MTGPEHYGEAQRLLDGPDWHKDYGEEEFQRDRADNLAAAQVHATLALAAAIAEARYTSPQQEWGGTDSRIANENDWDLVFRLQVSA